MNQKTKAKMVVLRGVIWGLAGALFGVLFSGLNQFFIVFEFEPPVALLLAAAISGAVTGAFYSAMPIALLGTAVGALVSIIYLVLSGHEVYWLTLALFAAAAGLFAGVLFSWITGDTWCRAMAASVAGCIAGTIAGALAIAVLPEVEASPAFSLVAGVVVMLTGSMFLFLAQPFLRYCSIWVVSKTGGPLVAALIAGVVGESIWIVGGTTSGALDQGVISNIDQILILIPAGLVGGLGGGAFTGAMLELLNVRWLTDR